MSFVITTPLYYVNDKPHLGSIYTTLICDSIARYKRLSGEQVIFITGVDEHGLKIQRTAQNKGVEPKSHCDEISNIFIQNWKDWDITHDKFVRTSSKKHESIVDDFYEPYNIPRQKLPVYYFQTGEIEVIKRKTILNGSVSGNNILPLINKEYSIDVDTNRDIQKLNK